MASFWDRIRQAVTPPASFNKTALGRFYVRPFRQTTRYLGAGFFAPILPASTLRRGFGLTSRESENFEIGAKVTRGVTGAAAVLAGGAYLAGYGGAAAPAFNTALTPASPASPGTPFLADTSLPYVTSETAALGPYGAGAVSSVAESTAPIAATTSGLLSGLWGGLKGTGNAALTYFGLSSLLGGKSGPGGAGGADLGGIGVSPNIYLDTGAGENPLYGPSGSNGQGTGAFGGPGGLPGTSDGYSFAGLGGGTLSNILIIGTLVGMAWWIYKKS